MVPWQRIYCSLLTSYPKKDKIIPKYYKESTVTISVKETTSIKLDVEVKTKAKEIFKELGITMGEAVNIFLSQVTLHKGLPFEVKIPNEETRKAIEDARQGINMESISLEEMIAEQKNMRDA